MVGRLVQKHRSRSCGFDAAVGSQPPPERTSRAGQVAQATRSRNRGPGLASHRSVLCNGGGKQASGSRGRNSSPGRHGRDGRSVAAEACRRRTSSPPVISWTCRSWVMMHGGSPEGSGEVNSGRGPKPFVTPCTLNKTVMHGSVLGPHVAASLRRPRIHVARMGPARQEQSYGVLALCDLRSRDAAESAQRRSLGRCGALGFVSPNDWRLGKMHRRDRRGNLCSQSSVGVAADFGVYAVCRAVLKTRLRLHFSATGMRHASAGTDFSPN